MKLSETRQQLVQSIIESLEQGVKPWQRGWSNCPNSLGLAKSLSTGKAYRGMNQWILQAAATKFGFSSCWFGTFNQIVNHHHLARIKKGSKSVKVILYKPMKREKVDSHGKVIDDTFMMMKTFNVFNVEQTTLENYQAGFAQSNQPAFDRFEKADQLFKNSGLDVRHGGNRAFYSPKDDYIQIPFESQFESQEHYYGTLIHECGHAVEKIVGLDRSKLEDPYPFCEAVVEMASCMVLSELGIEQVNLENSSAYIGSWLRCMKKSPKFLFSASSWASKIADHLLQFSPDKAVAEQASEVIPF